jgi:hypothetical protein
VAGASARGVGHGASPVYRTPLLVYTCIPSVPHCRRLLPLRSLNARRSPRSCLPSRPPPTPCCKVARAVALIRLHRVPFHRCPHCLMCSGASISRRLRKPLAVKVTPAATRSPRRIAPHPTSAHDRNHKSHDRNHKSRTVAARGRNAGRSASCCDALAPRPSPLSPLPSLFSPLPSARHARAAVLLNVTV